MNTNYLLIGGAILLVILFSGAGVVVYKTVVENNYDEIFAERGSMFAWASSCDSAKLSTWTCGKPCEYLTGVKDARAFYNSTHQVQGYTAYDSEQNNIIVSFRATRTNLNWLLDADFLKVKYSNCPGCKVHQGFLIAWKDLRDSVLSSTRDLVEKYPDATISVFGHSLGGAIAILGALDIHLNVKDVDSVYTFGQPRVGNSLFSAFFNLNIGNTYRLIHDQDPVPHLPMNSWGFVHEGTEVWYNQENTSYEVCALFSDDKSCSNQVKKYNFDDHDFYFGRNIADECE